MLLTTFVNVEQAKNCVASVDHQTYKNLKWTQQTAEILMSPSRNNFYESEFHRHDPQKVDSITDSHSSLQVC